MHNNEITKLEWQIEQCEEQMNYVTSEYEALWLIVEIDRISDKIAEILNIDIQTAHREFDKYSWD